MPNTNRVYWGAQEIAIGGMSTGSGVPAHGVQTVGVTTNFNLDLVLELGQLNIYEIAETLPSIEMTITKHIDGYPLIYQLASHGRPATDLLNRTNQRADVFLSIFTDSNTAASGTPQTQIYCSGMYINAVSYEFPIQGAMTESVTLVGNDKINILSSGTTWYGNTGYAFNGHFTNTDVPASGIKRRYNMNMGNGINSSVFPNSVPGIISGYNLANGTTFNAHIEGIRVSTNLNREDLYEQGKIRPYYRYARFPVAVNCSIDITAGGAVLGDTINASGDSVHNTNNEQITIKLDEGSIFDLGTSNRLQSITIQGGGTDGTPQTVTYNYINYNSLNQTSLYDPQ